MQITVEEFNEKYPIGTKVLYFPIYGKQTYKKAKTTSPAFCSCGMTMVSLDIGGGGYAVRNIEIDN